MFSIDDRVYKAVGDYQAKGTVIGVGTTKRGRMLYMVEYDNIPGLVHIHSDKDLMPLYAGEET